MQETSQSNTDLTGYLCLKTLRAKLCYLYVRHRTCSCTTLRPARLHHLVQQSGIPSSSALRARNTCQIPPPTRIKSHLGSAAEHVRMILEQSLLWKQSVYRVGFDSVLGSCRSRSIITERTSKRVASYWQKKVIHLPGCPRPLQERDDQNHEETWRGTLCVMTGQW